MTAQLKSIADRAVFIIVHVNQWGATQRDDEASCEIAAARGVGEEVYNTIRSLINPEELREIKRLAGLIRKYVERGSQPWTDGNGRLIATELFAQFCLGFDELKTKFDDEADRICDNLDAIYAASPLVQRGVIHVNDLPTKDEVRSKFSVELRVRPIPTGNDFRVEMSAAVMSAIRQDCENNLQEAARLVTADAFSRVRKVVGTMLAGLERHGEKEEGATRSQYLTKSSVDNVVQLVEVLDALNLADDPELTRIASDIRTELSIWDHEMLKDDPRLRRAVATEAKKIVDSVDAAAARLGAMFG